MCFTPWKTTMSLENQWLVEMYFLLKQSLFGDMLVFRFFFYGFCHGKSPFWKTPFGRIRLGNFFQASNKQIQVQMIHAKDSLLLRGKVWSTWTSRAWCLKVFFPPGFRTHVFAGGLKTGPIFKRFADMRNKRTRWIHCYLQYFVHFPCSLHGPEDAQMFIANLR